VDFLMAAEEAGADYASLCAYSDMDMFTGEGLGMALCMPRNRGLLREWSSAISEAVSIPVVFKIGLGVPTETIEVVETISSCGVPIAHVAMGSSHRGSSELHWLGKLAEKCEFLIAGGGVADVQGARRVLDAGAGAVAIATAAMKDPTLCGRLQRELRS
jgi:tRNA-dihydrouridine synthase